MQPIQLGADFMEEFYKEHPEYKNTIAQMEGMWCECESESEPIFHDDNYNGVDVVIKSVGRENCVQKHHYHCGWCLKLSQIG